jgi:hypothetical protein
VSDSSIELANSNQPNLALASPAGAFCFAQAAASAGQVELTGTKLEPNRNQILVPANSLI